MEPLSGFGYNGFMDTRQVLSLVFAGCAALLLSGCGSFHRPQYQSGSEGYQTQTVRGPQGQQATFTQGPFRLYWPVDKVQLTQNFKPNRRRPHHGIDLGGRKNSPIYSAHEGYVIYAGSGFKGYGKMIIVQFNNEWASLYSHLNSIKVEEGEYVQPRQLIGKMGRTGRASGVHLHFELMRYKVPIDPLPLLKDEQRLVRF